MPLTYRRKFPLGILVSPLGLFLVAPLRTKFRDLPDDNVLECSCPHVGKEVRIEDQGTGGG